MPDPAQMSGIPLPAPRTARRHDLGPRRPRAHGQQRHRPDVSPQPDGRRRRPSPMPKAAPSSRGYAPGDSWSTTTVDGEMLVSQEFTVPSRGGLRVALVAGGQAAAARERAAAEAAAKEPPRQGVVVIGGDSRIIFEFQSDVLTGVLHPRHREQRAHADRHGRAAGLHAARRRCEPLADGGLDARRRRSAARRCASPGPFAPGVDTAFRSGSRCQIMRHAHTWRQRWPAAFERPFLAVEKVGDMQTAVAAVERRGELQRRRRQGVPAQQRRPPGLGR